MKNQFTSEEEELQYFLSMVKSCREYTKEKFDKEAFRYVDMYKNIFGAESSPMPESQRIDVNIIYPTIKNLQSKLYFRDPKVYVRPEQDVINIPVMMEDEITGQMQPMMDPTTGAPMVRTFDAAESSKKFEGRLNLNIREANLKYEVKNALLDAELMPYGAIKVGWGNEQGVASMGEGAPPDLDEDVHENMAYAVRLTPWDVLVDPTNFYKPAWKALYYCVPVEQLKADTRLQNTEEIKGNASVDQKTYKELYKYMKPEDMKFTEYYEVFIRPCAAYPEGRFLIISEEVKTGFLYDSPWPYQKLRSWPIKLLYFNVDPMGGMPIPDVRYYAQQQKAKINLRNAAYEHVQRSLPMIVLSTAGIKNEETVTRQIKSNQIPRVVTTSQPRAENVIASYNPPQLGADFYNLDALIDNDTSRVTGMLNAVTPSTAGQDQLASALKLAAGGEAVMQNERADILSDFIGQIVRAWGSLYAEFLGPGAFTTVEGEKIPIPLLPEEIQGRFSFEIKPFSMSYEDPAIIRKQYVDLLNLLSSPETRMGLAEVGVKVNLAYIVKRILETYQERDIENFIFDGAADPTAQILQAMQENSLLIQGQDTLVNVKSTDHDKIHILIHQMAGDMGAQHILAHNENLLRKAGMSSAGGGNPEGLPVNGVAANQDLLGQSATPSIENQKIAMSREAHGQ